METPIMQVINAINTKKEQLKRSAEIANTIGNYDQVSVNNLRKYHLEKLVDELLIPMIPIEKQAIIDFANQFNADGYDLEKAFSNTFKNNKK